MKFRESSSPPPYLNKSDQRRMLRMMGILILVLISMKLAADPAMWAWLFPGQVGNEAEQQAEKKDIDYGVKVDEESPLPPDVFRSERSEPPSDHQPAVAESSANRAEPRAENNNDATAKIGDYSIEIDPEILAPVSDGWLGIRKRESSAFFAVIAKAKEIPLKALENAGDDRVDYTVLMTDSEQFRGRLLTVEGTIRLIESVSVSNENVAREFGVDRYYVAWMWTDSSGGSPYRLIATSLAEGMSPGKNLELPAKFTGYFFKREGYNTEQGLHVAPVLIGKHIRWNRPAVVAPGTVDSLGPVPYIVGFAVLIALALGLMIWRFNVGDKQFGHKHIDHFTAADPKALEELANLETHDPIEHFRQMEKEANAEASEVEDS